MNIAKILKNCPKGIKLYSSIYGEVEFVKIAELDGKIACKANDSIIRRFHPDGTYYKGGECMLFPSKEQRDWNKFMTPFRNGDVIIRTELNPGCKQYNIAIFSNYNANVINRMTVHCQVTGANEFKTRMDVCHEYWRLANYEEIKCFFTRMNESGYDFLHGKLVTIPIFKVGDTITDGNISFRIGHMDDTYYYYCENKCTTVSSLRIQDQDKWKLKKFDIHSLKPYDKVLAKNSDGCWYPTLVSYVESSGEVYLIDTTDEANYVIPFEGNEHLIGKFDDPDPYYITW